MYFETARLYLREFEEKDAAFLYRLDNDPEVMKYISSYTGKETTLEQCRVTIQNQILYYSINPGMGIWPLFIKATDEFAGWAALKYLGSTDDVEVGYRLMKDHWGKGYATEITVALIDYGLKKLHLPVVCAVAMPDNKASIRVMEKAGMSFIRYDRFYNCDVVYYAIER